MENTARLQTQMPPEGTELVRKIEKLGPWFQNLHLPGGVETRPNHPLGDFPLFKWKQIAPYLPADMDGWTVLDIGCNAGFYSLELARRRAHVVGIDREPLYLTQANWAAEQFGLTDHLEFRQMQIYDLIREESEFDLVLFMGVFYHLRYPLLALDGVAKKVKRLLIFQSFTMPGEEVFEDTRGMQIENRSALVEPGWPKMAFFEHGFASDRTNWWAPNHACILAALRSSGMRVIAQPGHEIYMCEPDPNNRGCAETWNREEFLSATGMNLRGRSTY